MQSNNVVKVLVMFSNFICFWCKIIYDVGASTGNAGASTGGPLSVIAAFSASVDGTTSAAETLSTGICASITGKLWLGSPSTNSVLTPSAACIPSTGFSD